MYLGVYNYCLRVRSNMEKKKNNNNLYAIRTSIYAFISKHNNNRSINVRGVRDYPGEIRLITLKNALGCEKYFILRTGRARNQL